MASGDIVVAVVDVLPPATLAATPAVRAGGSTPAESVLVWSFPTDSSAYLDFKCLLQGYDGGGLTFTLPWSAASASADEVRWEMAIRALPDDAEDIDVSHTYVYNGVTDTCASASGELSYPTIAFTHGPDMDSWADGQLGIVRLYRDHDHAADIMAGNAELWVPPIGRET